MFEPIYETTQDAVIKVVGVGGGGGNALNHMVDGNLNNEGVGGVEFFSVNTDAQVLRTSSVRQTIQIGANITKGLGAGANPNVGRQAAEEDREALSNMLAGADMVFISAGMGGGTGTGAAPVIADIAKSQGSLTVAIVTKPFRFEGNKRMNYAEQGIQELSKHVDSLIIIPNDKLLKVLPKNTKMMDAFKAANDILRNAVLGITDMITSPGLINVDFADVKTVMSEMGRAMMGTGIAEGEDRAEHAAHDAVASPLLEDVDLSGAKGILVSISSGLDIELNEVDVIMDYIHSFAAPDATIVFGTSVYPEMEGKLRVTLVATGIGQAEELTLPRATVVPQQMQQPMQQQSYQQQAQQPQQPAFAQQGYAQPAQFAQPQQAAPKPQQVDSSQVWSPNSIPGFMRNGQ
ncbi:cell division protein FtsZ [Actinobacillus pleuropneumoniae]|uniref:Cell division protein FtsZ n=2 Tax=Actinobacillus pleuropneumoniae TaxID=715 RepID=B3GZL3_ACTP7|nr:cell division protein FtsZ [Actinobacillus pleuropneumoniae]ACE60675.1 cell division protein FtsZ [Actinobacillus pleuropneumoniae serovar 7 str. AP76]ASU15942.1 Cell division protein FtsZ [Actinobacillus pleuropneumoniae]EFL79460.1 cell division protein FtsZ [Actinobacillus pleuropneumoniae serovar 2 str. 4226]EFM86630.1 Cell division protein ftsZ [Actinobacillus pleuropneumoniae serovar 2 str. S1536]EFN03742.1 Cell division protein ftsZ [Actinobacillus pleuropneumoniae serovar 13 str. N27